MKPGRELDALVAEKVMGWTECKPMTIEPMDMFMAHGYPPGERQRKVCPPFSRGIAAAWEVVEKLERYRMVLFGPHDEDPMWSARFYADGYRPFQDQRWDATANTAPYAICLAALKAVE